MVRKEQHENLQQHSKWQEVLNKGRNTDLSPVEDAVEVEKPWFWVEQGINMFCQGKEVDFQAWF